MGKVITVWGSPGSGKSMFSCILAKALTRDKRKAIIINAEISVPMLPVWLVIHDQSDDMVRFETLNSNYCLSMAPFPLAACNPLPMVSLAACA